MKLNDLISMTLRNLLRRKTRTLLTTTGVIVGTCAIVVMISMGIGMTNALEQSLASMGDLTQITIENYGGGSEKAPKLNDDMVAQVSKIPGVVAVSPFWDPPYMNMTLVSGRKDRYAMQMYQLKGVYPDALENFGYTVSEGDLLEPSTGKAVNIMFGNQSAYNFEDTKRSWRNNRVYPEPDENGVTPKPFVNPSKDKMMLKLASNEYDENGKPKYKTLSYDVKVTGVLSDDKSKGYETIYYAFMDIKDLRKIYKEYKKENKIRDAKNASMRGTDPNIYTEVKVKVTDIDTVSTVDKAIKDLGLNTYSLDSVREPMQKQMQQQQLFLGSLAAISLLVAAIGITNTMVMSIYERTREIGVMKVLGCKLGNIRVVFLMEAGLIGFLGGIFGVGISIGISKVLNHFSMSGMAAGAEGGGNFLSGLFGGMGDMAMGSELSVIPPWLILSAIAFATVIGLVSGFYPANRAVKISALEAIKHE